MTPKTDSVELSAARNVLAARASIGAFLADVERGAGITPVEITVLLTNLGAIGAAVPNILALLAANLGDVEGLEGGSAGDDAAVSRAFTLQIAQHYLEQCEQSVVVAAELLANAVNALSSLDPTA